MSEPTPLSAEAARAMTLLVMASRVDPNLRSAVADVETYIAELQREIAALKGALEKVEAFCDPGELPVQPPETIAALGTEFLRGFEMGTAVAKSYLWFEVLGRRGKTLDEIKAAQVLAGKEAQG